MKKLFYDFLRKDSEDKKLFYDEKVKMRKLEKNELLIKKHGGVERTVVGTSGRKYVVVVPAAPKSKEDRTEITL